MAFASAAAGQTPNAGNPANSILHYDEPARTWMTEALPLGNGPIGAMVFGTVDAEKIQFNHESLWTGDEKDTGYYQNFGEVIVDFNASKVTAGSDGIRLGGEAKSPEYSSYRRSLNIDESILRTEYTKGGVKFSREMFASHPAKVLVFRFSADKPGAHSGVVRVNCAHGSPMKVSDGLIEISGALDNGLKYNGSLKVVAEGGGIRATPGGIEFVKVNTLTLYLSAGTDYLPDHSKRWRGADPAPAIMSNLEAAAAKPYAALKAEHIADYQNLYSRFTLDLGTTDKSLAAKSTDKRLITYTKDKAKDPDLEELFVNYGRYLMISTSRPGDLPANLQGLWNDSNTPPWRSDYHSNINVQMNYWPAEPVNLSECHRPLIDYIVSQIPVARLRSKEEYGEKTRGWTVRTENGIFGGGSFVWNVSGSAWYAWHFWEHYAFSGDRKYLAEVAYPVIKEVCEYWEGTLVTRPDGTLVAPKGWSPEHGPTEAGVSYDQEIVYDLFTNYVEAADVLKIDKPYRDKIAGMREKLLKPKIGKWGQLQEWETDRDDPKDQHRHVSHLFALYPGRQITPATPELFEAAKVSLKARGDGGTGWSKAWKINFWARFQDGDHAYSLLRNLMTAVTTVEIDMSNGGGVYPNLFDAHPPFQIDGNFGATAGVAEMLAQSHAGEIVLLPALPSAWPDGMVKGLCARGGYELAIAWENGGLKNCRIESKSATAPVVRYQGKLIDFAQDKRVTLVRASPAN